MHINYMHAVISLTYICFNTSALVSPTYICKTGLINVLIISEVMTCTPNPKWPIKMLLGSCIRNGFALIKTPSTDRHGDNEIF